MEQSALQRAKAAGRARAKGRKAKPSLTHADGVTLTQNVIIPDIEFGAFTYIDQPPSPDYTKYILS